METRTNWLALIVSAVAGMVMGFLWYGMLFTNVWMEGNDITMEGTEKMMKNGVEMPHSPLPMIINAVSLLVYAWIMNWLINKCNATNLKDGATVGAAIGLIHLFGIYTGNRFAMNPTSLSMVDGFYTFLLFTVMGAIIGGWRPKAA
jgi:UDP-N-acetylmuramyl pentapeptide phosphotransferase/UDP-N-acetylglucosamine-1-phosphate transferase